MLDNIDDFERRVQVRAFHCWQEAGCPQGRDDEFWRKALEVENTATPSNKEKLCDPSDPSDPSSFAEF